MARDRRHSWGMPVRRSADQTPDLFSAPPPARPSDPLVVRKAVLPADEQKASEPRHVLPKDLARSLMRLDDAEIDLLLSAVTTEAQRRGRLSATAGRAKAGGSADSCQRNFPRSNEGKAERRACCLQGWRQALGYCPAIRDLTVRCPECPGSRTRSRHLSPNRTGLWLLLVNNNVGP